jgi:drug/metabolite transporter (DMT)-like permease
VRSRDSLLVFLAALAFSTASPLAKLVTGLSPVAVAAGRCAVASLAILILRGPETLAAVRGLKKRWPLAGAGALLAAHFGFYLAGLATTSLPAAVALVSLEPLAVVLAAWIAFRLRPARRELTGVLVATAGAVVVASGAGSGEHRITGDLLVLVAVALYGAYVAAARGLRETMPVLPYAGAVYGVAALMLLPIALRASRGFDGPSARDWGAVIALGLLPTLVGHTLVQRAARTAPPAIVALVPPGETIGSILLGAALLHTWPSIREWGGTALVLAGAVVAMSGRKAAPGARDETEEAKVTSPP